MKKIIAIILAASSLFFLTATKTLADWSAGVSASVGHFKATGSESEDGETNNTVTTNKLEGKFAYPSLFVEKNVGMLSIGLDFIPGTVDTDEIARTDNNIGTDGTTTGNDGGDTGVTNKASVSVSKHVSLYALVPILDIGAFVRVAAMHADLETKESLGTGSTYPDATLKGASISVGYQHNLDGTFLRVEVGTSEYDTVKVTGTGGHIVTADVDGDWARISVGKSF